MSSSISFVLLFSSLSFMVVVYGIEDPGFFLVNISSLVPSTTCTPPTADKSTTTSFTMPMASPYGPCNPLGNSRKVDRKTLLDLDDLRVQYQQGRLPSTSAFESKSAFPIQKGLSIGSGNFVVTIGLGTPMVNQTVEVDTGSLLTWVQCDPYCSRLPDLCYPQNELKFNPFRSTTSAKVYCQSNECYSLIKPGFYNNSMCQFQFLY